MTFQPGTYYVGDPCFIFEANDLRAIFSEILSPSNLQSGQKNLLASVKYGFDCEYYDSYFVAKMPGKSGTLYDEHNNGWGFEFGMFGCVPWEWIESKGGYENHKVTFTEPFDCSCTEDSVTIGHLHFTLNPK